MLQLEIGDPATPDKQQTTEQPPHEQELNNSVEKKLPLNRKRPLEEANSHIFGEQRGQNTNYKREKTKVH